MPPTWGSGVKNLFSDSYIEIDQLAVTHQHVPKQNLLREQWNNLFFDLYIENYWLTEIQRDLKKISL
jgi:hypothetical protein